MGKYLILLVSTALWLPHQVRADPDLNVSLKGGVTMATLAHRHRTDRHGLSGGLAGHLGRPLRGRFSLAGQVELLYVPRGADAFEYGNYLGRSRSHYVDVTIAARPEIRFAPMSIYLLLGGGLDLLVSANKENYAGVWVSITDDLHRVDVALLAAAGVSLHLPRRALGPFRLGTIFVEARHDHGLLDTDAVNGGFKNRSSSLMLGVSFALGGD